MTFAFIAKHRGIWPTGWLCEALGVSRAGLYAWRTRPPSVRARADERLLIRVRASFLTSERTYGARRVWHDMLVEGIACGRHRIERLMRSLVRKLARTLSSRASSARARALGGRVRQA